MWYKDEAKKSSLKWAASFLQMICVIKSNWLINNYKKNVATLSQLWRHKPKPNAYINLNKNCFVEKFLLRRMWYKDEAKKSSIKWAASFLQMICVIKSNWLRNNYKKNVATLSQLWRQTPKPNAYINLNKIALLKNSSCEECDTKMQQKRAV